MVEQAKLMIKATEIASNSVSSIYREKMMSPWAMKEAIKKWRSSSAGAREIPGYRLDTVKTRIQAGR
jgi:hypothetical protein